MKNKVFQGLLLCSLVIVTVNARDKTARVNSKEARMIIATTKKDHVLVRSLLSKRADVDARGAGGKTALIMAIELGDSGLVGEILNYKAETNIQDHDGLTALMYAARAGNDQITHLLLKSGAYVNAQDYKGWTPLMHAAAGNHIRVIKELLRARDINLNIANKEGETALTIVTRQYTLRSPGEQPEIVTMLQTGLIPEETIKK